MRSNPKLIITLALNATILGMPTVALAQEAAKPAPASAAATASDGAKLAEAATLFVHNVMIAKPEAATAAANTLLAESVTPSELAQAIDGADLGKRMDEAFRRGRRMADVADVVGSVEA